MSNFGSVLIFPAAALTLLALFVAECGQSAPADETPPLTQAAVSDEDLPGEPYDFGPDAGTWLAVVGVDYADVLNVRDVPFGEIIATLDASNPYEGLVILREAPSDELLASFDRWTGAIKASGRTRRIPQSTWPDSVWAEIHVAGLRGWARAAFLAPVGLTDDATAHLVDAMDGRTEAETLIALAQRVGNALASQSPGSRVVVVTRPILFEALGEVTVDVLNLADDSLLGYRLAVLADPTSEDWMSENPGPFKLRTVERTLLCESYRGVTAEGLCV